MNAHLPSVTSAPASRRASERRLPDRSPHPERKGGELSPRAPRRGMEERRSPMDPGEAERGFAERLEEAGLPRFDSCRHDRAINELQFTWAHGLTIHMDLARHDVGPIEDWERAAILGLAPDEDDEPIHVLIPGSRDDPRTAAAPPGVTVHRGPPLHLDDVTTHDGIRVTSPSRTLIDCAECMSASELRATFARAREVGLLDPQALRAARARVEWRPSLAMLDEVIDEFCG
jgi:hypothetical protein